MTGEPTRAEHIAQRKMVNASMLLADERKDRHNVTRLSRYRPCEACGEPRSFHACVRCDAPPAAA
jgi:hypothetical protein